jgi:hypothetical protein
MGMPPTAHRAVSERISSSAGLPRGTTLLLIGGLIYLYLILFLPPFIPIYLRGDAIIFINEATRMLNGEVPYRDFFELTTPGTILLYHALFKLLGFHHWVHNATMLIVGMSFLWLSVVISRRLLLSQLVLLPGALFLAIPFASRLDGTHHWFSCLAVTSVLAVLIDRRTPARIVTAGGLCGIALCFTQTRGLFAFLGLGVFLFWEWRKKQESWKTLFKYQALLTVGFLIAPAVVDGYSIWRAGFHRFLFCTVIFDLKYFPAFVEPNSFGVVFRDLGLPLTWQFLPYKLAFLFILITTPLSYLLFFLRRWQRSRKGSDDPWDQLLLVAIIGLSMLLSVGHAPSSARVGPGMLPALILLVWLTTALKRFRRSLVALFWIGAFASVLIGVYWRQFHWRIFLDTPGGRTAVYYEEIAEKCAWLQGETRPGQYVFDTSWTDSYVVLGLRNPTPIPFLTDTDYTRPEQVDEVIAGLEEHQVRYVLWSVAGAEANTNGKTVLGDHLEPLREYLRVNYHLATTFTDRAQVLERNSFQTHPRLEFHP